MKVTAIIRIYLLAGYLIGFSTSATAEAKYEYLSIDFIQSHSADFLEFEKKYWEPIQQALVTQNHLRASLLYRVKFAGKHLQYDYIRLNYLRDWRALEQVNSAELIRRLRPKINIAKLYQQSEGRRKISGTALFQLLGQAAEDRKPSKYIMVNELKSMGGKAERYQAMELQYFRPFHQQRVKAEIMNNWQLFTRVFPFGSRHDANFMTFNGYLEWRDIKQNNPPDIWQKTHGEVDFNTVHDEILAIRDTVNIEVWELVAASLPLDGW